MDVSIACSACGLPSNELLDFRCPSCHNPLVAKPTYEFSKSQIQTSTHSLWRYRRMLFQVKPNEVITLGEGLTPLVRFAEHVFFKMENLNPTGSFKDRGSTVLISAIHKRVKTIKGYVAEDSSGNAGASIAAYAARAELDSKIYVPKTVSGVKLNQIRSYGAQIAKIAGPRGRVAEEAQKPERGKFYVGHILHPLFRDGLRSLAYEIFEQSDLHEPCRIYLPVSAGTLLLGLLDGLEHLVESEAVKTMPEVVACQTEQVSPLYHRFKNLRYRPPEKIVSIADALASTNPPLLNLMVKQLHSTGGSVEVVTEEEIRHSTLELSRRGYLVEPSSAVSYAAWKKQIHSKTAPDDVKTIIILTGSGLKAPISVRS